MSYFLVAQMGSHRWGLAQPGSDYDCLLVEHPSWEDAFRLRAKVKRTIDSDDNDKTIYSFPAFLEDLKKATVNSMEVICGINNMSNQAVSFLQDMERTPHDVFDAYLWGVLRSIMGEIRNYVSRTKGNLLKKPKHVATCYRHLMMYRQIVETPGLRYSPTKWRAIQLLDSEKSRYLTIRYTSQSSIIEDAIDEMESLIEGLRKQIPLPTKTTDGSEDPHVFIPPLNVLDFYFEQKLKDVDGIPVLSPSELYLRRFVYGEKKEDDFFTWVVRLHKGDPYKIAACLREQKTTLLRWANYKEAKRKLQHIPNPPVIPFIPEEREPEFDLKSAVEHVWVLKQ